MGKNSLFFGGVPTTADVNRLLASYPREALTPGVCIPYSEIEQAIGIKYKSGRWRSVTGAWRKKLKDSYNIIVNPDRENPRHWIVLTETGKVDFSMDKLRSSVKMSRKAIDIAARVEIAGLPEEVRRRHDFNARKAAAIIGIGQIKKQAQLPEM